MATYQRGGVTTQGGNPNYAIDPSVLKGLKQRAIYGQTENDFGALLGYDNNLRFTDNGKEYIAEFDGPNMRIQPYINTGGGWLGNHHMERYNGTPYDIYNSDREFLGGGTWDGLTGAPGSWAALATAIGGPLIGAGLAGAAGAGAAGGAAGAGAGSAAADIGMMYAGADAAAAASLGGGASVAGGAAGAGGLASSLGGSAQSFMSSPLGKIISTLGSQALSGGGGNNGGGSGMNGGGFNLGGLGLNDLIGLIGGGVDAQRQGNAADEMKSWLQGQQAKIDNLYNPNTPEYNALWDEMSRKDAAAGRNSQYGPRSVDLAGRIAGIKADNTTRFTTGTSRAYADALNQDASKYSGLSAALQRAARGGSGGGLDIGSLIGSIFGGGNMNLGGGVNMTPDGGILTNSDWTGGTMSNDDIWDMINGGSSGASYGGGVDSGVDVSDWFV